MDFDLDLREVIPSLKKYVAYKILHSLKKTLGLPKLGPPRKPHITERKLDTNNCCRKGLKISSEI